MQIVASVADILHKTQIYTFISYQDIASGSIIQNDRIPVQEGQRLFPIYINRRESIFGKHKRQSQIGIRHEILALDYTGSAA